MNGTETMSSNHVEDAQGTYNAVVRPHQIKRGDMYYEDLAFDDEYTRAVVLESAVNGTLNYRGHSVPVIFVTGQDVRKHTKVHYAWTEWKFLSVTRTGSVNRPAPATRAPERTFLY